MVGNKSRVIVGNNKYCFFRANFLFYIGRLAEYAHDCTMEKYEHRVRTRRDIFYVSVRPVTTTTKPSTADRPTGRPGKSVRIVNMPRASTATDYRVKFALVYAVSNYGTGFRPVVV